MPASTPIVARLVFLAIGILGATAALGCRTDSRQPQTSETPRRTVAHGDASQWIGFWGTVRHVVFSDGRTMQARTNPEYFGPRGIWMARQETAPYLTFQGFWHAEPAGENRFTIRLTASQDCPLARVRTFQFESADELHECGGPLDGQRIVIMRLNHHVSDETIDGWTIKSYRGRGGSDLVPPGGGGGGGGGTGPSGPSKHRPHVPQQRDHSSVKSANQSVPRGALH